ncbi:MAG: protein kinase [Gemmatimonadetes bacterium]|nr:protein kinase [Gemmatimonadota bacterium]
MAETNTPSLAARLADSLKDDYTIEGEIGRGGMGVVYVARDLKLKRRVAIKVLPPDLAYRSEIRERFTREAQTSARLSHPHIVPIHAVGEADGLVYFVMGFVDGESLGARLKRRGKLPIEEVRRIMKETSDALGLAHTMGIIHRDIKPDNVLLDGTRRRVMVTDFGIAKALSDGGGGTLTGTGVAIGTPTYMSPEQAAGERAVDARSDLYALGVVGYEMLTGQVPFKAPTVPGILMKQITEPAPDILIGRPECPEELAATVMRCLEKDPENRWATADALRRALESRTSVPYRKPARSSASRRRPSAGSHQSERPWREWDEDRPVPARRRPRDGAVQRPRGQRPARRDQPRTQPAKGTESGEPKIVRDFRSGFASYVSVNGSLMMLNLLTGFDPPWFLFCAIPWGIGMASSYGKLWTSGYSWRDIINRPPAADAVEAPKSKKQTGKQKLLKGSASAAQDVSTDDYGKFAGQMRQIQSDRQAIMQMVERLPESEKNLLPDIVPTVDSLMNRAVELGRTLNQMEGDVDQAALDSLDRRIVDLEAQGPGPERERRLDLMRRQRETIADLWERRAKVDAQFESCALAIQNMRFDLLRLRSAGVGAVLDNLTMVTQQAKALSIDVNAAIDAAGEIREAIGRSTPSP